MFFQTIRRVQFRDTDAAGIAHYSVFFHWMEQTEHEMLRHFNWSVVHRDGERTLSWPRVGATCDYRVPLKFEQVFGVELTLAKLGRSSATYRFEFLGPTDLAARLTAPGPSSIAGAGASSSATVSAVSGATPDTAGTDSGRLVTDSWFSESVRPIAEGTLTAVCCDIVHGQAPRPLEIPSPLRSRLQLLQSH